MPNRKGFTLVEILIVMVVLGIVAGLAFPVYTNLVERSRAQEAIRHLDAVKDALSGYRSINGNYTGATFAAVRYDPNQVEAGQAAHFSYVLSDVTATTFTITAQREPAAQNAGNTLTLDQTGTITRNGVYA